MVKMTPFSHPLFEIYPSVSIFHFYISRTLKFNSMWLPLIIMLWSVKQIGTYMSKIILSSLLT